MDENLHNIEDLFQSALDDHIETPSGEVWEAVEKDLDKNNRISLKRKYTNLKRVAAMLFFLLAGFLFFFVYNFRQTLNAGSDVTTGSIKETLNSANSNKAGKTAAVILKNNNGSPSTTTTGTNIHLDMQNGQSYKTVVNEHNVSVSQKSSVNNSGSQNQADIVALHSEKYISKSKNETVNEKNKKHYSRSLFSMKIENGSTSMGEQVLTKNYVNQQNSEVVQLMVQKNISATKIELLTSDSPDIKKLIRRIAFSKLAINYPDENVAVKMPKKKKEKLDRFSITPFFSPDIAWYRLQDNDGVNQSDDATEFESEENHEFSSTFGVLIDYNLNKHWGLQSGLTFSNINIIVAPKTIYAQPDNNGGIKYLINTSSGYGYVLPEFSANPAVGDSIKAIASNHSLQYIGIPVAVKYTIAKGRFQFNALAGVSANILTRARLETTLKKGNNDEIETVDKLTGLKKIYFSGLSGIGVDYKISNKISLLFEPTMRFALNSINKGTPVKSYPMSLGIRAGLKINL